MSSTYRIQSGDTLSRIARRHGTTVDALAKANNIKNPDLIIAGRTLRIQDCFDCPSHRKGGSGGTGGTGGSGRMGHTDPMGHNHDHPVSGTTTSPAGSTQGVHAGRGWGGSEGVADAAKAIARDFGVPVTSTKRDAAATRRVGSSFGSDHYTGNTNAYAVDLGVSGKRGDDLARAIAKKYGIPESNIGTYNRHIINVDGKKYSVQLLWKVAGHYDHVHLGIRAV